MQVSGKRGQERGGARSDVGGGMRNAGYFRRAGGEPQARREGADSPRAHPAVCSELEPRRVSPGHAFGIAVHVNLIHQDPKAYPYPYSRLAAFINVLPSGHSYVGAEVTSRYLFQIKYWKIIWE